MTSVSQALPGLASAHAQSRQQSAGGKEKDPDFGEMVHGAEKQGQPQGKRPAASTSADPASARGALADPVRPPQDHEERGEAAPQKPTSGKTAKNNTDRVKVTADSGGEAQTADAATPQDRLPLQMALSELRHFASSPSKGGSDAEGQAEIPAFSGPAASDLQLRSSKHPLSDETAASEPSPRSARSKTATTSVGPDFGQKPASLGTVAELLGRRDSDALPEPQGQAPDEAAAPQSWRPLAKAAQLGQSTTPQAQAKLSSSTGRMDVVSQQSFPAPAQNPISQTASALVDAIASDSGVRQAFSNAPLASQTVTSVAVPTHVLKIELHPSELGAVTASLRLSGGQLSIEMKPETHEAYRRLTADSEAIVKSMRALGFEVDHVTILQPSIAVHSAGRTDAASPLPMSTGRDQPSFQPGNSGGNNAGNGRQPGRNDGNGAQELGRAASPLRERAGNDMYI